MRTFISRQPIIFFGLMSFIFSWFFWGVSPLFEASAPGFKIILDFTGLLGPSLVAIIITLTLKGKTYLPDIKLHLISFLFTFSLFMVGMNILLEVDYTVLNIFGALIISDLAAYIISISLTQRHSGHLFRSTVSGNISGRWLITSIIIFPIILIGGFYVASYINNAEMSRLILNEPLVNAVISIIFLGVFGGALGQELGWRGYLIPRALSRVHPLMLSLIIGVVWSLWYLPLYFNGVYEGDVESFIVRFIWNIPLAILFTWIFIRSKGNILTMIILHTSFIVSLFLIPLTEESITYGIMILLVLIVIISFIDPLMRKKNEGYFHLKDHSDLFF